MVTKPLQSATRNSNVAPRGVVGSFWRTGLVDDLLDDPLDDALDRRSAPAATSVATAVFAVDERLADLAVVAVDRDRLQPELPRQLVERGDVVDGDLLGHVHGLGDAADRNGCTAAIIRT